MPVHIVLYNFSSIYIFCIYLQVGCIFAGRTLLLYTFATSLHICSFHILVHVYIVRFALHGSFHFALLHLHVHLLHIGTSCIFCIFCTFASFATLHVHRSFWFLSIVHLLHLYHFLLYIFAVQFCTSLHTFILPFWTCGSHYTVFAGSVWYIWTSFSFHTWFFFCTSFTLQVQFTRFSFLYMVRFASFAYTFAYLDGSHSSGFSTLLVLFLHFLLYMLHVHISTCCTCTFFFFWYIVHFCTWTSFAVHLLLFAASCCEYLYIFLSSKSSNVYWKSMKEVMMIVKVKYSVLWRRKPINQLCMACIAIIYMKRHVWLSIVMWKQCNIYVKQAMTMTSIMYYIYSSIINVMCGEHGSNIMCVNGAAYKNILSSIFYIIISIYYWHDNVCNISNDIVIMAWYYVNIKFSLYSSMTTNNIYQYIYM